MWHKPLQLRKPGLLITGTDTEVGKTVVTCAIAAVLRQQHPGMTLGVCKPFASACRRDREGLVSADAEALAHFADCRLHLDVINPIRFAAPLAPAVAADEARQSIDWPQLQRSLMLLDEQSDALLIEGVGGLMVPLDPADAKLTFLDLAIAIGYPVLVVARSGLGTLNHTTMTVRLLEQAGCRVAGIVMNGYEADTSLATDMSLHSNRHWLARMTGLDILATVPAVKDEPVAVHNAQLPGSIIDAISVTDWKRIISSAM
jgi:dethiobiotin synthetase